MMEAEESEEMGRRSSDCGPDEDRAHVRRVRMEAEKLSQMVFTAETRDHLVRAGTEMILAMDSMIPRGLVPPEAKEHYLAAKRETMLLMKTLLDAHLEVIKDLEKNEEPPPSFHKIDLD